MGAIAGTHRALAGRALVAGYGTLAIAALEETRSRAEKPAYRGWTLNGQHINLGAFISAIIYFIIFMAVIYFLIVVPYRSYMRKRGHTVFGDPAPTKTCPRPAPVASRPISQSPRPGAGTARPRSCPTSPESDGADDPLRERTPAQV